MKLEPIPLLKSDERGIMLDCEKLRFIARKKGSISANHEHAAPETLYLVKGNIELTVGKSTQKLSAPLKITIPPNTYHKVLALSDVEILEDK